MSKNRNYRVRLYFRGDGPEPLPSAKQPILFDRTILAHVGTMSEWATAYDDARDALVSAQWEACCDLPCGAYWNADATGPLMVLGIDFGDQPRGMHGLRVTYEEAL